MLPNLYRFGFFFFFKSLNWVLIFFKWCRQDIRREPFKAPYSNENGEVFHFNKTSISTLDDGYDMAGSLLVPSTLNMVVLYILWDTNNLYKSGLQVVF